jgi:hypothetical protein
MAATRHGRNEKAPSPPPMIGSLRLRTSSTGEESDQPVPVPVP